MCFFGELRYVITLVESSSFELFFLYLLRAFSFVEVLLEIGVSHRKLMFDLPDTPFEGDESFLEMGREIGRWLTTELVFRIAVINVDGSFS